MKPHLPTALRRALLAITALLSPAVVTTTISTATLTVITAPAIADDLTLNTGSNAFATDLTVEKLNLASGITSATLEPDRSTITTLTVTADSISLTSAQTLILRNAKVIANKGIQTLLANVAGKDCISMNTSSIWGSGGSSANDVLLSSFINDKLSPNSQAYVYITKGHILFDVGIDKYLSCNLGDGKSEDSGSVSATISSELDSLKIVSVASDAALDLGGGSNEFTLNINELKGTVKTGRDLTLTGINGWDLGYASIRGTISVCEEENSEASITLDYVKLMGGSVSAHNIILKDVTVYDNYKSTLTATNELHIQGDIELKNTIANAGSTIIDAGKSLTLGTGKFTTGAVTIGAGATLNLGSSTTNLKGIITNNGTLVLGGKIDVLGSMTHTSKATFATTGNASDLGTESGSGFASSLDVYSVVEGNSATGSATWTVDGQAAHYDSGKVSLLTGKDTSTWWMNAAAAYSSISGNFVTGSTTTLALNTEGGTLQLDAGPGVKLVSKKATTIEIGNDVTLDATQLDASAADVTLSGSGSYTLKSGANALNTGVGLSDTGWRGTVNTTGNTTALELDKLGVSDSKVELRNASHTLAARDQEVAASLNSTGSVSLEGKELTLSGSNTLGSLSVGTLKIAGGSTAISGGLTTTGESSVADGAHLSIGGVSSIGGKITLGSGSSLVLAGTITLDDTAFTAGTRERYSADNNGYKITDTTYTVLTGGAATGTATWKVGTQEATYEAGQVIVAGIEDTAVYYVRNGDVAYTRALANDTTTFSLDGGHLVLNESLKDKQSIEWKSTASWLNINNNAVELKSSQLSTVGAGNFTLIAPDGGTYIIDKKVGDIVELTLGTGVTLSDEHWWGWVKTVGDTTVSSDLDTTGWKNTELNGTTTVNSGATLTLGGNTKLKGQIINNGTLVLGGNIDVLGSMTHTSKATFATTGAAGDLGTESGSGFASSLDVYSVVEGNSATGSATWTVNGQAAHYDSGKVSLLTGKDTSTWWMNAAAAYSSISGNFVTGSTTTLALNTEGGTLQLDAAPGVKLVSKEAATIEIGNGVTLDAAQLDASAANVTLRGSGSYTLEDGANTLGEGVNVGTGWSGTVNTTGDTSALELDTLGVSGSVVKLGSGAHTLEARDQSVAANLNSTGSVSLEGKKLTLSGSNTLGSLNVGSLAISGGSTTITNGLTTGGESSVATGATLSLSGNSTLGGKITNSGTLELGGNITVNKDTFKPGEAVENVIGYFIGSNTTPNSTNSGFEAACWDITIAEGGTITDKGATWKLVGDENATFDFAADGTLHAYGSGVGTVFHVAEGDTISYSESNAADFVNSKGEAVSAIQLNGGTLELGAALDTTVKSAAASSVVIADGVTLNASQLDTSAAAVTLNGKGSYTLGASANALNTGVGLGSDWTGTVNTTGDTSALELDTLGVSGSKVELGSDAHTLEARDQSVAANLSSTGSMSLSGNKLTLSGENTLGSLNVGSLAITGGSTTITNGLTIGGESSVATGATLSLSGNSTLGGKITNSGTLELGGNITVNKDTFKPGEAVENVIGYFIGSNTTPNSTNSGFEAACWDITIAEGGTITDKGATWKLVGDENATFDFATDGTLHAYGSGVGTVFHVAEGDTISYSESNAADFVNSKGEAVSAIQLNGGTLALGSALDTTVKSAAASSVVIADGVTLNASQLDASAADVTLSGKGSYTLGASANALNTGVGLGSDWTGTVKLTGAADALELSSLGNALSSIDLGSFNHTLAVGEHVIDSALIGSGSLTLNKGSKLTLNGDCSNWSGDIIGQVEFELTEGGTIGGNVQVDSLHIGESSATFEGNLTTTGTITVSENATLSLKGNTTLGGTIESADSGTVELAGQITVDVENFKSTTEVKDVTGYFIGSNTTPNSTNSGFEAACWDITIAGGGTITDKGATWKLVGDENATFDFAADGTLHAYGSGVGTVFHVAEGDTITYSESNAADFVNSKGEAVSAIQLNGGTLELGSALATTVKSAAASSVVIADGVTLNASQLDTSAADVTLRGEGSYTMQGQELSGVVELNTGVELDANEWKGTVYTGSTAQGAALDITALGNSQSTVYLGAQPMRRSMPGETVLESLTATGVGTTEAPGSLTLQKGTSTADTLVVNGILTLGSADAAAGLVADSIRLQGLSFAHADSSLVAGSLEGATTLNVQLTDEVLSNKDAGKTLTLVTLEKGFEGALTFNGSSETERVRSDDNRKEYTLAWNEAGTALTLTILGTESYVTEQVKPTTHNGKAGVALMTDVFLNSRPQKDAPDGALAGILNAVDAGTATDRDIAAVAGASTAALGMALSGDVERQLRAIRNRSLAGNDASTTTLVDEKSGMVSAEAPARFFAWVNAEGNRAEQNDDSTAAGYTLTSWGGTLGAGMQVNDQLTLGLALTAMYGDLQSDGPDHLKGDMDTTYVSAFARYESGKWSHAFIGTAGTMEADYKRTAMGYSNTGDTEGTAFGLMYELSRDYALSNNSSISPVFNISYRHIAVDGYSERGTDAALNVGEQSLDTVTVGLGARYAAVLGQQTLNRACAFEARALAKYDFGDTQTDTNVGFINHATRSGIKSAELGAFGVELGAGISVPVGSGSIFADGAVELRSDYTNFNATVGYKIQF